MKTAFWPWEIRYHISIGKPDMHKGQKTYCGVTWCHPWRTIDVDNEHPTCGKCIIRVVMGAKWVEHS